ncbi:hypothetical protein HD806DRAFT_549666 [Xylariaceae sp. AK1471]|nr:hypothetical protein HD806DRAFT_549666 [Xylariaceae sp. AK1471]
MPSGTDTDSQFRFLIACIRHSTAGKVDFEEVRKECDIISKGAAAKRYERLMKAHNIVPGGATNGVKKESKDSDETKKPKARATKKRKLEEVNEDEGDIDEPVKSEPKIKGEVKYEDAIVKSERANDDLPATTTPLHPPSSQPPSSLLNPQTDDDDEVFFISATEKRRSPSTLPYGSSHRHSNVHSPTPAIPGIQSVNYAANMTFPQQQLPAPNMPSPMTPMATSPSNSFPYGFAPTAWAFPHDSHGYL